MTFDPHAAKVYVDGSCMTNPGGSGGVAIWVEYPFEWNRPEELIESLGYVETTNNRMELRALIRALEWIEGAIPGLGVQRFQIVTDSIYVFENCSRAIYWAKGGWRNAFGRPIENKDLWKRVLSLKRSLKVRVDVEWTKGKKSPILRAVDKSAKEAAKSAVRKDRGFNQGKIGRSRGGEAAAAKLFPASGETLRIRVYQTIAVSRNEQKVKFQTYLESASDFVEKFVAYADAEIGNQLHRQNVYVVRMNSLPQYPRIAEILGESSAVQGLSCGHSHLNDNWETTRS